MKRWLISLLLLGTAATACGSPDPTLITLMTHDSFAISEDTIAAFEVENGVTVELLPAGDTGAALNPG